ncbi:MULTISPECIES: ligase-associated DNA damage response endonuclease PdeM [unclassified Janthinobacterium]|uniref:ligase-associated DNA damage response endonuclease PdeM n=1 Tax=unclassified Janthinobacterium TaxID=2610881 RepID=UPI001E4F8B8F|nr:MULTISPECIES: ligase-associated DNA damage response endonuclease PdeM [unclassified Janthinobacterium]MCC7643861.1 ligase-associated DNA damage response endonuclease PdeM [Janthinobacterium sp. EB271-G4-3-1]MCC7691172.1 ligase-associated DNA damage response endonuclease PdeM [Janthinobacterium sp. EB271-G4-3-2]
MSGPQAHCAVELDGEIVWLLAHKAIYWPARRMLVIADIHFGKAAAFRALGVPVPRGTTTQNLLALDTLLASYACEEIVFLGDFLHARAAHAAATVAAMLAWRARHPDVRLTVVRGNHDLHAGDPAAALGIRMVDEPYCVGQLSFCHHPDTVAPGYVLAGHVHPVFHLRGDIGGLRLPCFLLGQKRAILPSFGAFTGGHAVRPNVGERVYVTADAAIFPLPASS